MNVLNKKRIFYDTYHNWIFDLDNTIYDLDLGLFNKISNKMTLYISDNFNISHIEAKKLQTEMYFKYGLTLSGLIIERKINPYEFLEYVHNVEHPELKKDPELKILLERLTGNRYIYTNAPYEHANKILKNLGINKLFKKILDIKKLNFIPKPDPRSYKSMIRFFCLDKENLTKSIFIEDTVKNLIEAKNLGITTVWIQKKYKLKEIKNNFPFVDYSFTNLKSFLKFVNN